MAGDPTLAILKSGVASLLQDPFHLLYSETDVENQIKLAAIDISSRSFRFENVADITTESGTVDYASPTDSVSITACVYDDKGLQRIHVRQVSHLPLGDTGPPEYWYYYDGRIGIYPVPDAAYTINVYYGKVTENIVELPRHLRKLSIWYAMSKFRALGGWADDEALFMKMYDNDLNYLKDLPGGGPEAPSGGIVDLSAFTWNPSDRGGGLFLQNDNLRARVNWNGGPPNSHGSCRATGSISSGKAYWEIWAIGWQASQSDSHVIGLMDSGHTLDIQVGSEATGWGFDRIGPVSQQAGKWNDGQVTAGSPYWVSPATIMVAVDMAAGFIWWGINGTWHSGGDPAAGTNPMFSNVSGVLFPAIYLTAGYGLSGDGTSIADVNFGASAFTYTPPDGFGV